MSVDFSDPAVQASIQDATRRNVESLVRAVRASARGRASEVAAKCGWGSLPGLAIASQAVTWGDPGAQIIAFGVALLVMIPVGAAFGLLTYRREIRHLKRAD